jgi:hypothetical protein
VPSARAKIEAYCLSTVQAQRRRVGARSSVSSAKRKPHVGPRGPPMQLVDRRVRFAPTEVRRSPSSVKKCRGATGAVHARNAMPTSAWRAAGSALGSTKYAIPRRTGGVESDGS